MARVGADSGLRVPILDWPCAAYDWVLESSPDMAAGNWTAITTGFFAADGTFIYPLPVNISPQLFRLRR
jgi:hypothetical protein